MSHHDPRQLARRSLGEGGFPLPLARAGHARWWHPPRTALLAALVLFAAGFFLGAILFGLVLLHASQSGT